MSGGADNIRRGSRVEGRVGDQVNLSKAEPRNSRGGRLSTTIDNSNAHCLSFLRDVNMHAQLNNSRGGSCLFYA